MDGTIAAHLAKTPLTTLALFSVTHTKTGTIDTSQTGYKRITGAIGEQLIREAHDRGVAVQLVYSSFGVARNERFFASPKVQDATIAGLVALVEKIGVDGDRRRRRAAPRRLDRGLRRVRRPACARRSGRDSPTAPGVGRHGRRLGPARRWPWRPSLAGADRIFLMGYDYHYAGSDVGASAPMDRRDGADADLPWSLDLYAASGVPVEKTILGLPLYGMRWRVAGSGARRPAPRRRRHLGPGRQPEVPRRPAGAARARPDRGRRVLRGRADRQPRARRFARDRGLAGDLRRFARDADPQARPRRRPRARRRRVLGDRLRARPGRLSASS